MAAAKSPIRTIADRPVLHTAIAISSVIAASSFFTTSTRMGSNLRSMDPPFLSCDMKLSAATEQRMVGGAHTAEALCCPQHQIPQHITSDSPPRRDDHRGVRLFNNQRPALFCANITPLADRRRLHAMSGTKIRLANRSGKSRTPIG